LSGGAVVPIINGSVSRVTSRTLVGDLRVPDLIVEFDLIIEFY